MMPKPTGADKRPVSLRLSAEGRKLLQELARSLGLSRTGAIEFLIREEARRRLISPPDADTSP